MRSCVSRSEIDRSMPWIPSRRDALSLHHSLVVGAILLHMSYHSRMHNVMHKQKRRPCVAKRTSKMERISMFSVSHLAERNANLFHSEGGGSGTRSIDPSRPRDAPRLEMAPSKAIVLAGKHAFLADAPRLYSRDRSYFTAEMESKGFLLYLVRVLN